MTKTVEIPVLTSQWTLIEAAIWGGIAGGLLAREFLIQSSLLIILQNPLQYLQLNSLLELSVLHFLVLLQLLLYREKLVLKH